jgi:hypothetical protein
MIDISFERLISFAEAAKIVPHRRRGRATHVATIHRWATVGCRGIRLEWLQTGGSKSTSREAVARFFEALTADRTSAPVPTRTARQEQRDVERAEAELDKTWGVK